MTNDDPHADQPIYQAGAPLDQARAVVVMLHGRGASAADILGLAAEIRQADVAYLAPEAAGNTWYPQRFMEPLARNEPWLSSALATVERAVARTRDAGVPAARLVLLGFSQGACLALEYAARHARRYGGVVGLSGGLIGPDDTPRDYPGSLAGTPVFLGCSDVDPHIPLARVEESATIMQQLGGEVDVRVYPNMGHTVNRDELAAIRDMMATLTASGDNARPRPATTTQEHD